MVGPGNISLFQERQQIVETNLVISISTIIAGVSFFYVWHKDAKETAKQMQKLETKVNFLKETRSDVADLKTEISNIKQTLARIDTNISHLMSEERR